MKKILFLSFGLLCSALLGMELSRALDGDESLVARLFEEAGVVPYSNDVDELKQLAMDAEGAFQNLYLFSYQSTVEAPKKATLEELAKRTSYNTEELDAIVNAQNTEVILTHSLSEDTAKPDSTDYDAEVEKLLGDSELNETAKAWLDWQAEEYKKADLPNLTESDLKTQASLLEEYNTILALYNEELELQELKQTLVSESLAKELFYDGDLANSGNVDLLFDLDLIHFALFGEFITFPDRSGEDEDVSLASEEEASPVQRVVLAAEEDEAAALSCLDDSTLRGALAQFENDQTDGFVGDTEIPLPEPPKPTEPQLLYEPFVGSESTSTETPRLQDVERLTELNDVIQRLELSKKGDWSGSLPCNETFCITVNLVTGNIGVVSPKANGETVADPEANCVSCHTFHLEEAFKELQKKQLIPGRVSTNWFEDATCKEAGNKVNLDLNVYGIARPIDLDPGDDSEEKAAEQVQSFEEALQERGALPSSKDGEAVTTLPGAEACRGLLSISDSAGLTVDQKDALNRCETASEAIETSIEEARQEFLFNSKVEDASLLQEQLSARLYSILLYFSSFNDQLYKSYQGEGAPLPALLKKEYCS